MEGKNFQENLDYPKTFPSSKMVLRFVKVPQKYSRNYITDRIFPVGTERGVTQGNPVSLTNLNILMDAVVRAVLLEICRPQEAHHGLGWVAG